LLPFCESASRHSYPAKLLVLPYQYKLFQTTLSL
jgi:hypothetical protein